MNNEKIVYKIGDVASIFSGGDRPKICSDIITEECSIPIFANGLDNEGLYGYTNKAQIEGDCITISARGANIGTVFYRKEPFLPIVRLLSVIPNGKFVNSKYLYYYFKTDKIIGTGSAQPQITIPFFQKKKIFIYKDVKVQQKIANILSRYDEAIENNNKRIKLLEQMAQNLYKEWFVRFRFPGWQNVEFENGIPKGWKVKQLKDFGRIETGKTPSMEDEENYGNDFLFIKTPDLHKSMFVFDTEEKLSEKGHKSQISKLLPKNSIMVSCIGTAGIVSINMKEGYTNQQINSIILNDITELEWLFYTCKSLKETIELFGATGATMTNLSKGKFEKLKLIYPEKDILNKYHKITKPIFDEIQKLLIVNQNLAKQRDLLLPRLMSGKVEV